MAALTQNSQGGPNAKTFTSNTLTASDTLTYQPGTGQEIILINNTAGAVTATITGSAATSGSPVPGGGVVNYAAGYNFSGAIPVGGVRYLRLDDIPNYLLGAVAITGGTGLTALLMAP